MTVAPATPRVTLEQVASFANLVAAAGRAISGHRGTRAAQRLLFELEPTVLALQRELLAMTWRPGPFRTFTVFEPKERRIAAAPMADRVVHHALCGPLTPVFEAGAIAHSYACRVGKGAHKAAAHAQALARRCRYFLKADVRHYFDSVDHTVLRAMLAERIDDGRVLELLGRIIDHQPPGAIPGRGIPIGNLSSQHFANLYLAPLDRAMVARHGGRYLRYMDDLLLFGDDKAGLHRARADAAALLGERLRLELKAAGTFVAPVTQGVPFVGRRIFPGTVRLAHASRSRFVRTWRRRLRQLGGGLLDAERFLRSAESLVGHLRHLDTFNLRQAVMT